MITWGISIPCFENSEGSTFNVLYHMPSLVTAILHAKAPWDKQNTKQVLAVDSYKAYISLQTKNHN